MKPVDLMLLLAIAALAGLALWFLLRRRRRGGGCGGHCSGCQYGGSCPSAGRTTEQAKCDKEDRTARPRRR